VGFQRRYFYLERGSLVYFKAREDRAGGQLAMGEVPLGELRGVGALLAELVVRDGRRVRLKGKSRTYELEAGTEAEAEAWAQAIVAAIREG